MGTKMIKAGLQPANHYPAWFNKIVNACTEFVISFCSFAGLPGFLSTKGRNIAALTASAAQRAVVPLLAYLLQNKRAPVIRSAW
jgi:hypothetical protein